jgi:hypothetical protein
MRSRETVEMRSRRRPPVTTVSSTPKFHLSLTRPLPLYRRLDIWPPPASLPVAGRALPSYGRQVHLRS